MGQRADVVVLGGGPAGAAVVLRLARLGRRAILVEARDVAAAEAARPSIGETLAPGARPLLEKLGIWRDFQQQEHTPAYGICGVWGSDEMLARSFLFQRQTNGWHLDRRRFDAFLLRTASDAAALARTATTVRSVERHDDGWRIRVEQNGERCTLEAAFIVDATGQSATLVRQVGAQRLSYDRLVALGRRFPAGDTAPSFGAHTLVEASERGWFYSAPLPTKELLVVMMTDADIYSTTRRHDRRAWDNSLSACPHTLRRLQDAGHPSPIHTYLAGSGRSLPAASDRWFAVGDAAVAFDPLYGQGICFALRSGIAAANSIHRCMIGDHSAVVAYNRAIDDIFARYLRRRQAYYGLERRWQMASFWQRRHRPADVDRPIPPAA